MEVLYMKPNEIGCEDVDRTGLTQNTDQWLDHVDTIINLPFHKNFIIS